MLPSSISMFWSLTQAPSTPRSVDVARVTACWMASSKLVSEVALSSVTLATDIYPPSSWPVCDCSQDHYYPRQQKINASNGVVSGETRAVDGSAAIGRSAKTETPTHDTQTL